MLKKVLIIAALFFSGFNAVQTAAAEVNVESEIQDAIVLSVNSSKVYVNGKQGRIDENDKQIVPFVENGNTMVPLRFLTDKLGGDISWDPEAQEITIKINSDIARIRLGDTTININDRKINMNVASKTMNGITYLPLRQVVEDLFHKKLYYKNGIILISNEVKTISESTLVELERTLKPRVVYTSGRAILYVYSDGTSFKKDLEYSDGEQGELSVWGAAEGYFYIRNEGIQSDSDYVHKINLDGTIIKTIEFDDKERMHFVMAQDGNQYYYSEGNVVKVSEDHSTTREIVGKGILMQDTAYIKNDEIWFTDSDVDYAIYKLHNGEKTKLSKNDSFIHHVLDNWIYYGYFENNRWTLYRMALDGSIKTKLSSNADVKHSYISNGKIYYIDENSKTLSEMNLDGSNKRVICKLGMPGQEIMEIDGGYIYYTEEDQHMGDSYQFLFRVRISDGTKVQLVKAPLEVGRSGAWKRIDNMNVLGEFVSYTISNGVFMVKDDGSNLKEVSRLKGSINLKSLKDN